MNQTIINKNFDFTELTLDLWGYVKDRAFSKLSVILTYDSQLVSIFNNSHSVSVFNNFNRKIVFLVLFHYPFDVFVTLLYH